MLTFAWPILTAMTVWSALVVIAYLQLGWQALAIPFLPVATIGTAVAFYVGFKNNSAYDRLWEARRIWGGITNTSRTFATMVLELIDEQHLPEAKAVQQELLYRHLAYINVLRLQLRRPNPWNTPDYYKKGQFAVIGHDESAHEFSGESREALLEYLPMYEVDAVESKANIANHLLHKQTALLTELKRQEVIDGFEHSDLVRQIANLYDHQGGAERIKTFPFPRQYANFSRFFVYIFAALLPFGLIGELSKHGVVAAILTVPFSVLIAWVFNTMEQVGDSSENPFENGINDVPISAICRNIEIDLLALMNSDRKLERLQPVNGVLL